jgi:hemoglobin/transferrin/lactoferrin receptor protein
MIRVSSARGLRSALAVAALVAAHVVSARVATAQTAPQAAPQAAPKSATAPAPAAPVKPSRSSALADTTRPALFLDEVVVTGSRYPRAYFESPQALSFLSRTQIRELAPTVLGDVLQLLPGVDNSKDSPWEQRPVLRGLSGQRVLVLMDGSPMNSARGNGPHPSLVDAGQVDRVEVVRGPSSVAYGSDALGGAINIITRQAPFADGGMSLAGSATLGGSSVDRQRNGYLELMPRFGKFAAFLSSGGRRAEDFESPKGKVPNSGFTDYNALFNLRYDFSDRLALKGGYQVYRGNDIGIPGLSFVMPGASQDFAFSYYDRDAAHLTLERAYRSSWLESAKVKTYYQRESRNFFSDQVVANAMYPSFGIFGGPSVTSSDHVVTDQDRIFDLDTYGAQIQATSPRMRWARVSAGLDAARDQTNGDNVRRRTFHYVSSTGTDSSAATSVRTTASVPDGAFDNLAGFAQSEWYLHPQWTLSTGARLTHYRYRTKAGLSAPASGAPGSQPFNFDPKSLDKDALSGSAGLVYAPMPDLHLTANVANGFRQPNAQDLYFEGPASVGYVMGNPDLAPERSVSYDLGLRWGPGNLGFSGNLFYSTYKDLIDAISVPPPPQANGQPTYQYVNISQAVIWGGEAEAEWRFHPQWQVRGAVSGAVGDITNAAAIQQLYGVSADRAPLPNVPPFRGQASLRWRNAPGWLWIEPSMRFSWRTNRLPLPTPGVPQIGAFKKEYLVGDVLAGARIPTGQRIVLGVRNIADVTYRLPLGSLDEPGRSFVGQLSADF